MIHTMDLNADSFEQVKSGTKKIEYCLCDEKNEKIKCGDRVFFTNFDTDEQIEVRVINIYKKHTFSQLRTLLFASGEIEYKDFEPLDMLSKYSLDEQYKHGVMAIVIYLDIRPNEVNEYIERFGESPFQTVSEYVVAKAIEQVNEKYSQAGRKERFSKPRNMEHVDRKLVSYFREDVLVKMAYYIKCVEKEMDEAELEKKVSLEYRKSDLECLLDCACNLKYPLHRYRVF